MDLTNVKGIGPATAIKLQSGGIDTAERLAQLDPDLIIVLGIGKATAIKIIKNAQEVVGTAVEETKKAPKKKVETREKVKPEEKQAEPSKGELLVEEVAGVGPKTKSTLQKSGITTVRQLAESTVEDIVDLGIGKATANKILKNARETLSEPAPEKKEEVFKKKAEKPKKKPKKRKEKEVEHERSPMPQGIPTKKKRGVQIRGITVEAEKPSDIADKPEGWGVRAKVLSKEELEAKKKRQEEIARSRQITRVIPTPPVPVKAVKDKKVIAKGEKPVKIEKIVKKRKKITKKKQVVVEFFSQGDLYPKSTSIRSRGISAKSGTKKPRIELDRNTYLGRITSHRRSRRVVHNRQVILDLDKDFNPEQLVGQKVYFTYPDNMMRVAGSVSKRFGKTSSGKVLINFKKGIRMEGIHQKVFIK